MANVLGVYNPQFYANEALIALRKSLGMASRVHLGFDEERRSFNKGEVINIRRPSTFTVQDAPGTAEDVNTGTVQISLDYWREVKFKLSDKELAFTGERIINDHIAPAAYELGNDVDEKLSTLWEKVPHEVNKVGSPTALVGTDIVDVRQTMFANKVPLHDMANMHLMIDGQAEAEFLKDSAFVQHQGAGLEGVATQRSGHLTNKYGFEIFANQNVQTSGTVGTNVDLDGLTTAAHSAGATNIAVDNFSSAGTFVVGDIVTIGGVNYTITADVTMSSGAGTLQIFPALVAATTDNQAVTAQMRVAGAQNLAFHRNAFALVTAPLSNIGGQLGAKIGVAQDPVSGLAVRSRMYYVGNSSEVHVALDVLYGFQELDGNLACRMAS